VGTLICAEFLCCGNVRVEPPVNEINPDAVVVVRRQIDCLMARTELFLNRFKDASARSSRLSRDAPSDHVRERRPVPRSK
jgi:hypothetical protein